MLGQYAVTFEEEKKELNKLSKEELIELVGGLKTQKNALEEQEKIKGQEARKVIEAFLSPSSKTPTEDVLVGDPLKCTAFEKLKKRFK